MSLYKRFIADGEQEFVPGSSNQRIVIRGTIDGTLTIQEQTAGDGFQPITSDFAFTAETGKKITLVSGRKHKAVLSGSSSSNFVVDISSL